MSDAATATNTGRVGPVEPPSRGRRRFNPLSSRSFALWYGVIGPPLLWGANLALGDLIYELGCSSGMRRTAILSLSLRTWGLIQTGALEALIVLAGLAALGAWREVRGREDGTALKRAQALSIAGIASACVYSLLLLFVFVPQLTFFHTLCGTSL
jgi:hypothetical protein